MARGANRAMRARRTRGTYRTGHARRARRARHVRRTRNARCIRRFHRSLDLDLLCHDPHSFLGGFPTGRRPSPDFPFLPARTRDEDRRCAGPTKLAGLPVAPEIMGMTEASRTSVRKPPASPRDRVPRKAAASAGGLFYRTAHPACLPAPEGRQTKKGLSFTIKDRPSTCGATFIGPAYAEPSHEHANTCSASNAGSRSRYSVGLHRAFAPLRRSFPLSLGEPFTAQLPTGIPAAPALCECS